MKSRFVLFFCLILNFASAQESGFENYSEKKITIPFQLINNLVFITVEVNGVPLTFLLDTGVSQTLLFSIGDKDLQFKNSEKTKFTGLGGDLQIEGLKSRNNMVKVSEDFRDYHHTIFIILDEDFNFSSYIGIPVHGIMGYDFFKNNPIEIDYTSKRITVYKDDNYYKRKTRRFTEIPLSIENKKPYILTDLELSNTKEPSKLLIDTGNSDAVWLFPETARNFLKSRPHIEDFLGKGFNGDIHGLRGRIHQLNLENFIFEKPIVSIPDENSIQHVQFVKDRKGSIGGELMRRFTAVFDYKNKKLLLKMNRNYNDPYRLNMSGLEFRHIGSKWEEETIKVTQPLLENNTNAEKTAAFSLYKYKLVLKPVYAIVNVRLNSPADKAGLKSNDVLETINGRSASNLTLTALNEMMRTDEGKNLKFEISRNDVRMKFNFTLVDPIPYQE